MLSLLAHEPGPERALPAVTLPHGATDVGENVAAGCHSTLRARPSAGRELLLLELLDERFQRALEPFGDLTEGHGVAQQRLRVAQQVVCALADRDLEREASGSERSEPDAGFASRSRAREIREP